MDAAVPKIRVSKVDDQPRHGECDGPEGEPEHASRLLSAADQVTRFRKTRCLYQTLCGLPGCRGAYRWRRPLFHDSDGSIISETRFPLVFRSHAVRNMDGTPLLLLPAEDDLGSSQSLRTMTKLTKGHD